MDQLVFESAEQLVSDAVNRFSALISQAPVGKTLRILLTGGTLGIEFCRIAATRNLDLSSVELMFSDERFVELTDPDRNEAQALAVWPQLGSALVRFPSPPAGLEIAAKEMDANLARSLGSIESTGEVFDLTILGMGPDGHIASLFPGHDAQGGWVVFEPDSPKPPKQRLSLSYLALNRSSRVWFLVSGKAKADAVRSALSSPELPAGRVAGGLETLWFMDSELKRAL